MFGADTHLNHHEVMELLIRMVFTYSSANVVLLTYSSANVVLLTTVASLGYVSPGLPEDLTHKHACRVEELDQPELKNKPMAVGGIGMICTANYEVCFAVAQQLNPAMDSSAAAQAARHDKEPACVAEQ